MGDKDRHELIDAKYYEKVKFNLMLAELLKGTIGFAKIIPDKDIKGAMFILEIPIHPLILKDFIKTFEKWNGQPYNSSFTKLKHS